MDEPADSSVAVEALVKAGRMAEAEARAGELLHLEPTVGRLHDLATVQMLAGNPTAAEPKLREAMALAPLPRIRASLGLSLLAQGRLAEGFAHYDAWREIPDNTSGPAPKLDRPMWSGEELAGKNVLVWSEEGVGDQIMYARFVPLLRDAGANVIWACNPALERLIREGLAIEAVPAKGALRAEGLDYLAPTSRLPVVFMQRLTLPPGAPYLRPPAAVTASGMQIGVIASGNPNHHNDHHRSLSPAAEAELMALPGAFSLKPENTGARDFWDTARIIMGLDLVITVDTSVAHLAGALGKPVWVLLPAVGCDWRWGRQGAETPWYTSMRLFRQLTPGDWSPVLTAVRSALGIEAK